MRCKIDMDKFQEIYRNSLIRYGEIISFNPDIYNEKDAIFQKDLLAALMEQELMESSIHQDVSEAEARADRRMSESLENSRLSKGDMADKEEFRKELALMEKKILICILDIKSSNKGNLRNKTDLILNKINLPKLIRHIGVVLDNARYELENDLELERRVQDLEENKEKISESGKSMEEFLEEIRSKPPVKPAPSYLYEDYPLVEE